MENDIEIIDFYQPRSDNSKNLFITGIICCGCPCSCEHLIEVRIFKILLLLLSLRSIDYYRSRSKLFADDCALCGKITNFIDHLILQKDLQKAEKKDRAKKHKKKNTFQS